MADEEAPLPKEDVPPQEEDGDDDDVDSEMGDQFDEDANRFLQETEGQGNFNKEEYERAQKKQVATMNYMLLACMLVAMALLVIPVPFALRMGKEAMEEMEAEDP
jgi:hypothetical protein